MIGGPAAADVPRDCVDHITGATYHMPTTRYPHGALGDEEEWTVLTVAVRLKLPCRAGASGYEVRLPQELVFEDVSPRLWDVTGDGLPEVVVVESHAQKGARLAIWGLTEDGLGRIGAAPFIGTRFRWLAPVAAADLDGDGAVELAWVDRPHLAKTLRVWRWERGQLVEVTQIAGLTNHRFGDDFIQGGLRNCGGDRALILADGGWQRVVAVRLKGGGLEAETLGPYRGPESLEAARACG